MLKKILITIAATIAAILVYAGLKSPEYEVSREIAVNAPPEKIFPYLNNMKLADQWGPWKEMDPTATMTLSGPEEGVGAKSSWSGGTRLGTGSATITESITNSKVGVHIVYTQPEGMEQESEYLLQASDSQTTVVWRVRGQNSFMGRVMCLFINMDKLVGGMFEMGLMKLKAIVEEK